MRPAPDASTITKYADYPVDYSTGIPQISIPIHDVKSGSLSVPISISYHASGRRANDQDGAIALGWSLNAGGIVARTVYGAPDFGPKRFPFPFKLSGFNITSDLQYFEKIMQYQNSEGEFYEPSFMDSEYDIFTYSFNGHSGKIVFKDSAGYKTPVLMPYKPYKVIPTYTVGGTELSKIEIIDDKGVSFRFLGTDISNFAYNGTVSAWSLNEIVSADKLDTISFTYTAFTQNRISANEQIIVWDKWNMAHESAPNNYQSGTNNVSKEAYHYSRLTGINYKEGKVKFNLETGKDKVKSIQIFDKYGLLIKGIHLTRMQQDLATSEVPPTNKLTNIAFQDPLEKTVNQYEFEYYPTKLPSTLNAVDIHFIDWWGYYNASGVNDMIPMQTISFIGPGTSTSTTIGSINANREPDLEAMKSGVLKRIKLPTGGVSEFTYEHNKFVDYSEFSSGITRNGPGLRIYKIITTDPFGESTTKTFRYGTNESGTGYLDMSPTLKSRTSETIIDYLGTGFVDVGFAPNRTGTYRERVFSNNVRPELSPIFDRPVVYPEVTQYDGTETENIGKTVFKYDYAPWAASGMPQYESSENPKMHIVDWNFWNTPSLRFKTIFERKDSAGTPTYTKVKEIENQYDVTTLTQVSGLHIHRVHDLPQTGKHVNSTYYPELQLVKNGNTPIYNPEVQIYTASSYNIPSGYKLLKSTKETIYDKNLRSVSSSIVYSYNSQTLPIKISTTGSDGKVTETSTLYPTDFIGDVEYGNISDTMLARNMIDFAIEQSTTKAGIHVKSNKTKYKLWAESLIAPELLYEKFGTGSFRPALHFHQYDDQGNILSLSKDQDKKISYLWDYSQTLPIAEALNAASEELAYTSFESDGSGRWNGIDKTKIENLNGITGRFYYNGAFSFSTNVAPNSAGYTLSYWSRSGAYQVNGTTPKIIKQNPLWTLYEHNISGTGGVITISGSGIIDELKLHPTNSLMSTSTYNQAFAKTSEVNPSGQITKYYYDSFGRLLLIQDELGNTLKQFCYNYQGQTSGCNLQTNDNYSQTYTAQCSSGSSYLIPYSVPAGTYFGITKADANSMAQLEASVLGPKNANNKVTCSQNFVNVSGYNSTSKRYQLVITSMNGSVDPYTFELMPNKNFYETIGNVLTGNYRIQFHPYDSMDPVSGATFEFGNYVIANSDWSTVDNVITIDNVLISGPVNARMYIP